MLLLPFLEQHVGYVSRAKQQNKPALPLIALSILTVLLWSPPVLALDTSLDISQYAHTAWPAWDRFSLGNVDAMAQTPDGYLWFGTEFGLFRFDGVRSIAWQPPAGQSLPHRSIYSLLVTRDGTLWIGTFAGLATWSRGKLTRYPELDGYYIASLFEDHEGSVWVGGFTSGRIRGRLCTIRGGSAQCHGEDGAFGEFVWSFCEDSSGNLWAGAESGLWRWKRGSPRRYVTPGVRITDLSKADDGRVLI